MADGPINPDREQQRRDNIVSRRQSGLEPRPEDLEDLDEAARAERARTAVRPRREPEAGAGDVAGDVAEDVEGGER